MMKIVLFVTSQTIL